MFPGSCTRAANWNELHGSGVNWIKAGCGAWLRRQQAWLGQCSGMTPEDRACSGVRDGRGDHATASDAED